MSRLNYVIYDNKTKTLFGNDNFEQDSELTKFPHRPNKCCALLNMTNKSNCIGAHLIQYWCRKHKGHLVHIDSMEENAFVKDYISRLMGK